MYKRENAIYINYSLCYEVAINRRLSHRRKNIEEVSISMKTADDRQKVGKKLKKKITSTAGENSRNDANPTTVSS